MTLCKLKFEEKKTELHIPLNAVRINGAHASSDHAKKNLGQDRRQSYRHHQWQVRFAGGSCFFLTGLIWARTVFCIDIGNIVFIHMMKIHLPHMYMIFVESHRKQVCSSILQYLQFFNTFRIISDSLKPFAPNSLGPFQLLQRHFLLFF